MSSAIISSSLIGNTELCRAETPSVSTEQAVYPSDKDNQLAQVAFRDFDLKRLDDSDKEFTLAIERWKELHRPRDEIVSLLKAR